MEKVNNFSVSMKKISSELVVKYFERRLKDKYVTNKMEKV